MIVISKNTFGEDKCRNIRGDSLLETNTYGEDYAIIPPDMEDDIIKTCGYCDIKLNKDGTEVVAFAAREIPAKQSERPVTEAEQLRADLDYLAIMTGVTL